MDIRTRGISPGYQRFPDVGVTTIVHLSLDVLYNVVDFLSIPDIVRLRQVSKFFYHITWDRMIWSKLYRDHTLRLPRPPGPYAQQPVEFLADALVMSERVGSQWPPARLSQVRTEWLPITPYHHRFNLVSGKWLLVAHKSRVICCDIRVSRPSFSVIYKSQGHIKDLKYASTTTNEGEPLNFAVLATATSGPEKYMIKVFKLDVSTKSFPTFKQVLEFATTQGDVVDLIISPRLLVISTYGSHQSRIPDLWIMDVINHQIYILPPANSENGERCRIFNCIPTATHLIAIKIFEPDESSHSIEAFPIPRESINITPEPLVLQCSHRSVMHDEKVKLFSPFLLSGCAPRPSVPTNDIHFTLAGGRGLDFSDFDLVHLTLHEKDSKGTITAVKEELTTSYQFQRVYSVYTGIAFDGCVRGICHVFDDWLQGFVIDLRSSNRYETGRLKLAEHPMGYDLVAFDGERGVICRTLAIRGQQWLEIIYLA
ncbi:hypothetical protein BJ138DRAFT_1183692 [Hygrophoropsis aurantiaca]|uniref:Uncharacterized protein n=1 Tax=Hygrophoropsis aurantiaca TaxID=72124 RepID=A0ACB7ZWB4_9AGAM|nr:hypothetical protein BJ138DRAFT_1183692 [Hygrophoropsis aurantiaca]